MFANDMVQDGGRREEGDGDEGDEGDEGGEGGQSGESGESGVKLWELLIYRSESA